MTIKRLLIAACAILACLMFAWATGAGRPYPAAAGGVIDPTCTSSLPCIEYDNNGTGPGIRGISVAGNGLAGSTKNTSSSVANGRAGLIGNDIGTGSFNSGVHGLSVNGAGVSGNSTSGDGVDGTSTSRNGVQGISTSTTASGVYGQGSTSYGLAGRSTSGTGAFGESTSGSGISGTSTSGSGISGTSKTGDGVLGSSSSRNGVQGIASSAVWSGVYGQNSMGNGVDGTSSASNGVQGTSNSVIASGVYGQNNTTGYGVAGRAGTGTGVYGESTSGVAVVGESLNPTLGGISPIYQGVSTDGLGDFFTVFTVDTSGNVNISGKLTTSGTCSVGCAPKGSSTGYRVVSYAPTESLPTMEDTGEAQLVNGAAYVHIDPAFANVIDQTANYVVLITPEGDSRGLYVTQKSPTGFAVHENQGGRSTLAFGYRIVAKPYGSTAARLPMVYMPKGKTHGPGGLRPSQLHV